MRSFSTTGLLFTTLLMSGCGTQIPQIEEIWDDRSGSSRPLERKIKTKIYCELRDAVRRIDVLEKDNFIKVDNELRKPLPESWGVQMTITLTVVENSTLNPMEMIATPLKPVVTYPSGIAVSTPQSFSLGIGAGLSADATRIDKFTFFYQVKDLESDTGECRIKTKDKPQGRSPDDLYGSSLLLESDLGIYNWLNGALDVRTDIGIPTPNKQEALSYDVKFQIVSNAVINPTWKLVHYTTGGSGNFFSTKRDRTHELLLSFGPTAEPKTPKALPQPGSLAAADALVLQLQSAVNAGVRSGLIAP